MVNPVFDGVTAIYFVSQVAPPGQVGWDFSDSLAVLKRVRDGFKVDVIAIGMQRERIQKTGPIHPNHPGKCSDLSPNCPGEV